VTLADHIERQIVVVRDHSRENKDKRAEYRAALQARVGDIEQELGLTFLHFGSEIKVEDESFTLRAVFKSTPWTRYIAKETRT